MLYSCQCNNIGCPPVVLLTLLIAEIHALYSLDNQCVIVKCLHNCMEDYTMLYIQYLSMIVTSVSLLRAIYSVYLYL